jgi:hypothetical protein
MPILCKFENCKNRASYGYYYEKPERCKEHKENRKPQYNICVCGMSQPFFNYVDEKRAMCCKSCKKDTMVDIKHKKCRYCNSRSNFNYKGEKAMYCSSCKKNGMINVNSKKCICNSSEPTFNYINEKIPLYCYKCKNNGMIDIKNKKCKCGVRTSFNYPNEKISLCCYKCKKTGMININSKKCQCKKSQPIFNYIDEKIPLFCSECKKNNMVDIKNKKCYCNKSIPTFNYIGNNAQYCNNCKKDYMIDVNHKNCKGQNNTCTIRGNKKYKGYCTFCFQNEFPNDPLSFQIRCKTKEIAVREYINKNFEGFTHDKCMFTGHCDCTIRRRIDHRKLIANTLLVIETDENQHKHYDKMDEETRYNDLFMAFSGKWIYIRFNPDKYVNKNNVNNNPTISTRLTRLHEEIDKQINRILNDENTELIERIYLYFDNYD